MSVRALLRAAVGDLVALALLKALLAPSVAHAGPPFLTDDPEPTPTGHWEIYAPFVDTSGRRGDFEGSLGAELNYGASENLQLTLGLPLGYTHSSAGWRFGRNDLEASAKYRFFNDEEAGFQIATFPGITAPTGSSGVGTGKVTAYLPIWAQKDVGSWSVFGGGGYAINPGAGSRNYWRGGVAVTRQFSKRLLVGIEADRQGADVVAGQSSTSFGIGFICNFTAPFRALASVGPTFNDGQRSLGFHGFFALGIDL